MSAGTERPAPTVVAVASPGREDDRPALATAVGVALAQIAGSRSIWAPPSMARLRSADPPAPVLVLDADHRRGLLPALAASPAATGLERRLRDGRMALDARACGYVCAAPLPDGDQLDAVIAAAEVPTVVVGLDAERWAERRQAAGCVAKVLGVVLPRQASLVALAVAEQRAAGCAVKAHPMPLGRRVRARALRGLPAGGGDGARLARTALAVRRRAAADTGQALVATLTSIAVIAVVTMALAAVGGAMTGAGRAQRAADLVAVSAARSMHRDLPRALAPATLPDGRANRLHLSRAGYLARARSAARRAATANGASARSLRVRFREGRPVPTRVAVSIRARARVPAGRAPRVTLDAEAAVLAGAGAIEATTAPTRGSGDYRGPLAVRQGKPMRPDVAAAFDRLLAAARRAGHGLTVNSGYRSDAEQARLWAANPNPRWVARPGTSLHRCGTELDLGPPSAHAWLRGAAERFGFRRRYPWEPWHFGYVTGPAPCSAAASGRGSLASARATGGPGRSSEIGDDGRGAGEGLPTWVPGRYRAALVRAAAGSGVSALLLAAQLRAESGFNPRAVSPAGARGIAQFMPATARAWGLADPFDPHAAIAAQARFMASLMRRFGSSALALAAYNAGPGAVARCRCMPYAETRGYVARILALMGGASGAGGPAPGSGGPEAPGLLEVRLVA